MSLSERVPRGGCLAGSGRWQTPSDPWQLFARTNRRQHDRIGIAESVAPTRADSSAKYRRTLADRFRQQQRNFFKQATDSSTGSTERRRSARQCLICRVRRVLLYHSIILFLRRAGEW